MKCISFQISFYDSIISMTINIKFSQTILKKSLHRIPLFHEIGEIIYAFKIEISSSRLLDESIFFLRRKGV